MREALELEECHLRTSLWRETEFPQEREENRRGRVTRARKGTARVGEQLENHSCVTLEDLGVSRWLWIKAASARDNKSRRNWRGSKEPELNSRARIMSGLRYGGILKGHTSRRRGAYAHCSRHVALFGATLIGHERISLRIMNFSRNSCPEL